LTLAGADSVGLPWILVTGAAADLGAASRARKAARSGLEAVMARRYADGWGLGKAEASVGVSGLA
jgi:NADP-dependent 3-hydroxy acid dehydrogenase YdfG